MSIATIITRGYGSFGTVNDLPTRGYSIGAVVASATTCGGVFRRFGDVLRILRRLGDVSRVFGRGGDVSRTFTGYFPVANAIQYDTRPKDSNETILYLFDFSRFPELKAGETISSVSVPSVSGLTFGTASVTTATHDGIPAGYAVKMTVAGGTEGTTYNLECRATTSGGSIRVVKGRIIVE